MMAYTHLAFGALAGILTQPFVPGNKWIFLLVVTFSSLFPDIDHEGSKINKIFPVTRLAAKFLTHRGFFHTIFPPLIIFLILQYFNLTFYGVAIGIGYMSHLISDSLTKMGINFLHPIATFRIQGFILTGGAWETLTFYLVMGAAAYQFFTGFI